MRRSTCCLLVVLLGSWLSSLGQSAPKFTTPQIVATFQRLNQTNEIKPVTIYTPQRWGTFRISIVMVGTIANGDNGAFWGGGVQFEDASGGNGGFIPFGVQLYTQQRNTTSTEFPIRAKAGKPIKLVVLKSGNTDGTKYNVWVVVEQLM
jgi:hypothetical protein